VSVRGDPSELAKPPEARMRADQAAWSYAMEGTDDELAMMPGGGTQGVLLKQPRAERPAKLPQVLFAPRAGSVPTRRQVGVNLIL
jgi:hypothetical protein